MAFALQFREGILAGDPVAVVSELDRLVAQLNGQFSGIGQNNPEADLENGIDSGGGIQFTTFADLSGPFILPVKDVNLQSDTIDLDPGEFTTLRVTPSGATRVIRGIKGGTDGRVIEIYVPQSASNILTVAHADSTADSDKRIFLVGVADVSSVADQVRGWMLRYDGIDRQWIQMGGSASIAAAAHALIVSSATSKGTSSTDEEDLITGTLPANTMQANTDYLRLAAWGTWGSGSVAKTVRLYLGSTVVQVPPSSISGGAGEDWYAEATILRAGASSQVVFSHFAYGATSYTGGRDRIYTTGTAAEDLTTALTLKVTGEAGSTTQDQILAKGMIAEYIAAPL